MNEPFVLFFHYLSAFGTINRLKVEHGLFHLNVDDIVTLPGISEGLLPPTVRDGLPSFAAALCALGPERFQHLLRLAHSSNHPAYAALCHVASNLAPLPECVPAPSNTIRLFVMRHAPRTHDCTFSGPLHPSGTEMANAIAEPLARIAPIRIFSSPFLRCLHTVAPTVAKLGMTVATDMALAELLADPRFAEFPPPDSDLPDVRAALQRSGSPTVDPVYVSTILHSQLRYPESMASVQHRVQAFMRRLFGLCCGGSRVLVCTHMHLVNAVLCAADPTRDHNALVDAGAVAEVELTPIDGNIHVEVVQMPHIPNMATAEWRPLSSARW